MKKFIPILSLCAFAIGVVALLFYSVDDSKTSIPKFSGTKTQKNQKKIDRPRIKTPIKETDEQTAPIKQSFNKTTNSQTTKDTKKEPIRVEFRTFLPNGKLYDMPVQVEQNGEIFGGTEMILAGVPFFLQPGEAVAFCTVDSLLRNIGHGQSDPLTFLVTGKPKQFVDLTLRECPGYYIDLKNGDPKNDAKIYYDVIYDKTGQMTDAQVKNAAIMSDFMAKLPEFKLNIDPGLYYIVASSVPYRIEFVKQINVGTRFESRSFKLPKALGDDYWRFVKVLNLLGKPITTARFRVSHNFISRDDVLGNRHNFTPVTKHLGHGLYKVKIPLTQNGVKDYRSSILTTYLEDKVAAITPFKLDQNNIEVLLLGKGDIEFSIGLKGRNNQQTNVVIEGPEIKIDCIYPEKKIVRDLNAGKYLIKVFLRQSEAIPLQREALRRVLVYQKWIDLKQGENKLSVSIEVYDRVIQTKTPKSLVVVFQKNGQRDHPWLANTDADGRVKLENLIPGEYLLEIAKSKEKVAFTVP
ncbi:MAG: hypothetical protein P1V97_18020 [Planctomycetota bacterium]|nr:hypothetical protein [Planctomycetota bacterium]